jgi:spermidine synthase
MEAKFEQCISLRQAARQSPPLSIGLCVVIVVRMHKNRKNKDDSRGQSESKSLDPGSLDSVSLLVLVSGAAALAHQLLWTRRMIDLLGASTSSTTRVLGCFFLGLAIGAAIAAKRARQSANPWRTAGVTQMLMAVMTLPVLLLPSWADFVWPAIGPDALAGPIGGGIKFVFAAVAVLPPAALMGFAFPMIVEGALRRRRGNSANDCLSLYASNTVGGAAGLVAVMLVTLPWLGVLASMILATAIDFFVGVVLFQWSRKPESQRSPAQGAHSPESELSAGKSPTGILAGILSAVPKGPLGVAFFSGAAVLALEVLSMQMFMLVATMSLYAPAAILFSVIVSLAIAATMIASLPSRTQTTGILSGQLVAALLAAGFFTVMSPLVFMMVVKNINAFGSNASVMTFMLKLIALALLSTGPAWVAAGCVFPLSVQWCESIFREPDDERAETTSPVDDSSGGAATRLGWLLMVNGIGGFLGAEIALRIMLPGTGVYGSIAVVAVAFTVVAAVLVVTDFARQERFFNVSLATVATIAVVAGIGWLGVWQLPTSNLPASSTLLDTAVGPEGVVSVVKDSRGERMILVSNQYSLGGTAVRYDQERQMLLPMLMHPQPEQVAAIGLATGITAGAALEQPEIKQVTAIELSPLVVRAADQFFREENYNITRDGRAKVVVEDGRTYIASAANQFDVIEGDLFLPWAPGEIRLYSREHFQSTKAALTSDGVFCQWLAMYQLTPEQFAQIAATFQSVFPNTFLMLNHFRGVSPALALVGFADDRDAMPWSTVQQRCENLRLSNELKDPLLRHVDGVRMLYLGRWKPDPRDRFSLVTLTDPSLEFSTASVRIAGDPGKKYFYMGRWLEFCRDRQQTNLQQSGNDAALRAAIALSGGLMELDFAKIAEHPAADAITERLGQEMPEFIKNDVQADWGRWPASDADWR